MFYAAFTNVYFTSMTFYGFSVFICTIFQRLLRLYVLHDEWPLRMINDQVSICL